MLIFGVQVLYFSSIIQSFKEIFQILAFVEMDAERDPESAEVGKKKMNQKNEAVKEYWSEHRITLIAYQAQYINSKKPIKHEEQEEQEIRNREKKKKSRKKIDIQYQSAFLSINEQISEDFNIKNFVKEYEHLNWIFSAEVNEDFIAIRQFLKIMLQLKHSVIVRQFCEIYNIILKLIKSVNFEEIVKEESRYLWLQSARDILLNYIQQNIQKFPYFKEYLEKDNFETKKLILVEIYCFLAERFNFNINEFYSEAFNLNMSTKGNKKVKKSQE